MSKTKIAIYALFLCSMLCINTNCSRVYAPNRGELNDANSKLKEIEKMWTTLPIYPNSKVLPDENRTSTDSVASISRYYTSDAQPEDLKRFYMERLPQMGWSFESERPITSWGRNLGESELSFTKGDYKLILTVASKAGHAWQYAINVNWHKP